MIQNDLQRLRWMILDEALRDPVMEYFMGERTKTNETGNTRSLIHYVNTRLKAVNREFSCSKRMLQNDVAYFQQKGARLEPRFRRGHKRILRYINLDWKNPLLKAASFLKYEKDDTAPALIALPDGPLTPVTLRISKNEEAIRQHLGNPFGTDVEVLAPENFREEMRQAINALQKLYKKDSSAPKNPVQGDLFDGLF